MSGARLDFWLIHGAIDGDIAALFQQWHYCDFHIAISHMGDFERAPSLLVKLRGAIGQMLLDGASDAVGLKQSCDWQHSCASEVFFGKRSSILMSGAKNELAKPFTLAAWSGTEGELVIRLRVFGLAIQWAETLLHATIAGLRGRVDWPNLGKDVNGRRPTNIQITEVKRSEERCGLSEKDWLGKTVRIAFVSGLNLGQGGTQSISDLFAGRLMTRLGLMAPWMGVSLNVPQAGFESDGANTKACPQNMGGHRHKSLVGQADDLVITIETLEQNKAVMLGATASIGRGASIGLGRYSVSNYASIILPNEV